MSSNLVSLALIQALELSVHELAIGAQAPGYRGGQHSVDTALTSPHLTSSSQLASKGSEVSNCKIQIDLVIAVGALCGQHGIFNVRGSCAMSEDVVQCRVQWLSEVFLAVF